MALPANLSRVDDTQSLGRWVGRAASNDTLYFISRVWDGRFKATTLRPGYGQPPSHYAASLNDIALWLTQI